MVFSYKNPASRPFCRKNFNIRAPGMKFWSILAQFTLGKYRENIAIILHQMKYCWNIVCIAKNNIAHGCPARLQWRRRSRPTAPCPTVTGCSWCARLEQGFVMPVTILILSSGVPSFDACGGQGNPHRLVICGEFQVSGLPPWERGGWPLLCHHYNWGADSGARPNNISNMVHFKAEIYILLVQDYNGSDWYNNQSLAVLAGQ